LHRFRQDGSVAWLHEEIATDAEAGARACQKAHDGDFKVTKRKTKGRIGSSFDDFLDEQGIRGQVEDMALKEIISDQIATAMKAKQITKTAMARRMGTSRRQLDRLLDPHNQSVTLLTLRRAAAAVGRTLRVELK
jgi:hypothetical protein